MVLRIDDTDVDRNTEASLNSIYEGLNWLDFGGMNFTGNPSVSICIASSPTTCWRRDSRIATSRLRASEKRSLKRKGNGFAIRR